ncbi:MAG TPA: ATP-binding protein [Actinomycetota bacterium]|nr:ATP-binding protein [Actinomycetota bacterium]
MRVRTRLVVSFTYALLVVIVALTVPLAIVLRDRARAELEAGALTNAQTTALLLDASQLGEGRAREDLVDDISRFAEDVGVRVVVLDPDGVVVADSDREDVGQRYDTPGRPEVRNALDGVVSAGVRESRDEGGDIVVAAAPVVEDGELVGVVRISRDVEQVQRGVTRATIAIGAVAIAGLVAGLVLAFILARSLSNPLSRLASAARGLGRGDFSVRAGRVSGGDELEQLGRSFDEMAARVERTVRAQREFVANASHQLRTPLTGIKLRIESAIAETDDAVVRHELQAMDAEVDRMAGMVDRLLVMSREVEEGQDTHVDAHDAAVRAADRWADRATAAGATLAVVGEPVVGEPVVGEPVVALTNPGDLGQILDVLLDNAITYAPSPIEIRTASDGSNAIVSVVDRGSGIRSEDLPRVTERFYRGQGAAGGGSGLGLAIARELAEKWGGSIAVTSDVDGGTRVDVRFRRVRQGAADVGTDAERPVTA